MQSTGDKIELQSVVDSTDTDEENTAVNKKQREGDTYLLHWYNI